MLAADLETGLSSDGMMFQSEANWRTHDLASDPVLGMPSEGVADFVPVISAGSVVGRSLVCWGPRE